MAHVYDNWDRLVRATLRREELRLSAERTPSDISSSASSPSSSSDLIATSSGRASCLNSSSLLLLAREDYSNGLNLAYKVDRSGDLLPQYINLGGGLQRDAQFVIDELGRLLAFLRDADAKKYDNTQIQEWSRQVLEVAYDTEDVLEELIVRFARGHPNGFYGLVYKIFCSIKNMRAGQQISLKIKHIKSRSKDVSARLPRYRSIDGFSESGSCSTAAENVEAHIQRECTL